MQLRGFNELKVKIQSKNTKRTQRKATAGTGLNSPKAKKKKYPIRKAINPKSNKPDRIQNQGKDPKAQRETLGKRLGCSTLRTKIKDEDELAKGDTETKYTGSRETIQGPVKLICNRRR